MFGNPSAEARQAYTGPAGTRWRPPRLLPWPDRRSQAREFAEHARGHAGPGLESARRRPPRAFRGRQVDRRAHRRDSGSCTVRRRHDGRTGGLAPVLDRRPLHRRRRSGQDRRRAWRGCRAAATKVRPSCSMPTAKPSMRRTRRWRPSCRPICKAWVRCCSARATHADPDPDTLATLHERGRLEGPPTPRRPPRLPLRHRRPGERRRQPHQPHAGSRLPACRGGADRGRAGFRKPHPSRRCQLRFALHKPPATASGCTRGWLQLFRQLQPAIVHTRNLAALECQVPALWAGVPVRIHGEHGRDVDDLDGTRRALPVDAPALPALRAALRGAVARPGGVPRTQGRRAATAHRADLQRRGHRALPPTAGHQSADRRVPLHRRIAVRRRYRGPHADREGADPCWPAPSSGRCELAADTCATGCAWSWWATARCAPRHRACSMPPVWASWPGCPASAPTCRMSCAASIASCLPSLAEGISNTILEAMAMRAARAGHRCRRQRRTGGRRAAPASSCRRAMSRRWPRRWCAWQPTRLAPPPWAGQGAHGWSSASACRRWWRPTRVCTTGCWRSER